MAIRNAWFMPKQPSTALRWRSNPIPLQRINSQSQVPEWSKWPQNQPSTGLRFAILEQYLKDNVGPACDVQVYEAQKHMTLSDACWKPVYHIQQVEVLTDLLQKPRPADVKCYLYLMTEMSASVVRLLGYHLDLTPRFFNFTNTPLHSGVGVERCLFFGLQIMDRYDEPAKPGEAMRSISAPSTSFKKGQTWYTTRISLVFVKSTDGSSFNAVCILDPLDKHIRDALQTLMLKVEDKMPGQQSEHVALIEFLSEVFYVIGYTWGVFIEEASQSLKQMSSEVMNKNLPSEQQIAYTRRLHQNAPLYVEVRRRLIKARDLTQNMCKHPFFLSLNATDSVTSYVEKVTNQLDEHIERTKELTEESSVLISLIFNIATLQDTRAAIDEARASNELASSIRRVTLLTFIFLPLTLAVGVFGMNIRPITGDRSNPEGWVFAIVATGLLSLTTIVWLLWSTISGNAGQHVSRTAQTRSRLHFGGRQGKGFLRTDSKSVARDQP